MAKLLYEDEVLKARTAMEAARDKFQKLAESLTDAALALVSDAVKALEGFSSRSLVTDADKALLNDFFRKENFSISDPPTSVFLPRVELLSIADAGRSGFVDWGRALASLDALMTQRFGIPALEAFVQRMQAKLPKPSSVDSVVIDVLTGGEALLWLNCQEFLDKLAAIHKSLDEIRPAIQDLSTYEQGLRKYLDALKRGRTSLRYLETNCVHSDSGIWLSDFWPPWPFGSSASSAAPPAPAAACCAASAAESTGPTCRGRCPPLPPPSERKVDSAHVQESTSVDPNAKFGPAAFGPDGFLQPGLLVYEIEFENDPQAGATIPAQEVWITDTLDGDLDLATVEFTGFGFNNLDFAVPAGLSHYETTLDLRPYGMDLLVPVQLDVNATTRVLSAYFGSRDPRTGQLPDALDAGFLPVNDKPLHNGEGYLRYRVRPRAGLPSGTVITNRADIKFDVNAIIPTPETKHTLDVGAPSSQVAALPSMSPTSFAVTWQGSDDAGGSGIAGFDVLVSTDGGPFLAWQTATANTSAVFVGQIGHSYRFYSIATDNVGHREAVPENPDAHTAVSGNLWHNAANRFDVSGSNDVTAQDVLLIINYINKHPGDQSLPAPPATPPPYYDVTDDGLCTANDALLVINEINRRLSPTGAGEADGEDPAAAAVVVVVALPRAARGDYPTEPQPTAASAAGLAVSPTRGESATWTGRRDREAAPLPVQAAGRDGGLAGTQPVLAARRVWTPRTLEELDAAFSLWDDLLPLRAVDLLVA